MNVTLQYNLRRLEINAHSYGAAALEAIRQGRQDLAQSYAFLAARRALLAADMREQLNRRS